MARLVVVSNRVSVPTSAKRAGGLAVAVEGALRKQGGVWIGWNGQISDGDKNGLGHQLSTNNIDYITFSLSLEEYRLYYERFSNRVLWPTLHYREDLIEHSREAISSYRAVNLKFADFTARVLAPEDLVWVQDYHLFGLGAALRRKGVRNPIGFFLHVPFPPGNIIDALPSDFDLADLLSSYDVVGVQTERDASNLRDYIASRPPRNGLGKGCDREKAIMPVIKVVPVGIETELMSRAARMARKSTLTKMTSTGLVGRRLMISVERLDYSKGIPQRLRAYDRFLSEHPEWRRHISLLQIAPLTRDALPEYASLADEVDRLSGRINGRYADLTWSPLHYVNSYVAPFPLAGLLRAASVGLVTPLRDGMNLVAKEYVAAQDAADPGVLILSRFAGAAEQLRAAILVDPRHAQEVGDAIKQALEMPKDERRSRHADMMDEITAHSANEWCHKFVAALKATRRSGTNLAEHVLPRFEDVR